MNYEVRHQISLLIGVGEGWSVAPALVRQRGKLRYKAKHRLIIFDKVEYYYHMQIDI